MPKKQKVDLKNRKDTIRKIFRYIKRYKRYLFLSILLAVVCVSTTLYIPILIGNIIDQILGKGAVHFTAVLVILKKMIVVIFITAAAQWLMNLCNNHMTYHVVADIRKDAFRKIQNLPIRYLDQHSYGDLVSRMIADADLFADGLLLGFTQLFTGVVTILLTLVFMLQINVKITLIVVCITPISFGVANFISKRTFHMFQKQSKARGEETVYIEQMLGNQKVVKSFQREDQCLAEFDEINDQLGTYSLFATFYSSLTNPATRFVNNLVYMGVGIFGAISVIHGRLSVGELTAFLSYANQYNKPFNDISSVITELQNSLACAERIFELMEEEPQPSEPDNAITLTHVDGSITLKDVAFSYDKNQPLIEGFQLKVKPGERIAIVGPTGCGKTTLINLLMRFYDVDKGSISLNNHDIRQITRNSLRHNFGMVLQDTWLKTATIYENILMGKPSATKEEVVLAAKQAHADPFIKRLPNGYDTVIGEDGGLLSQGEKQLLCIARVMLCFPPMLILDEATSSIDTRTELLVQNAFTNLMKDRTCFIVAHRLSTIRQADLILVMDQGKIIERGTHKSLLEQKGFYAKLYHSQFAQESNM